MRLRMSNDKLPSKICKIPLEVECEEKPSISNKELEELAIIKKRYREKTSCPSCGDDLSWVITHVRIWIAKYARYKMWEITLHCPRCGATWLEHWGF